MPPEDLPGDLVDVQIESHALTAFLHDYCFVPENDLISRGYLVGLETLLAIAGPSSDLAKATKVVSLASIGTKLNRPVVVHKARIMYSEILQSLRVMISNAGMARTAESLMIAVLLGLYEIITATATHPSNHGSHSCGVYAILSTKSAPLDLLDWGNRFQISDPYLLNGPLKVAGILCILKPHISSQSLYVLAMKTWPLLKSAESLLSSTSTIVADLNQLLKDAKLLNAEFSQWPAGQPVEWRPSTIAFIDPGKVACAQGFGWFPPRIDTYLDLYVAAIWNRYRKTRLLILNVIIRCSNRLGLRNTFHDEKISVEELANDLVSSIPFHLSENLTAFVEQAENASELAIVPGKSIGGLLLMHPLFATSNLLAISPQLQGHMKKCLAWIGAHMGIGQATWLSNTSVSFPNESVAHGYAIIWAGMLFTRFEGR